MSSFIINDAGQEQLVAGKTKKQKTITDKIDFIYLFSGKFPMKKYKKTYLSGGITSLIARSQSTQRYIFLHINNQKEIIV